MTAWSGLAIVLGLVIVEPPPSPLPRATKEVKDFEVVSVEGDRLVLKGADGAREIVVPPDFRFVIGGQRVPIDELRPGMRGSATITTTTTTRRVYATEIRSGVVMRTMGNAVVVRAENGIRMFSQGEVDRRGVRIVRGGRVVSLSALREGDRLTATIVTEHPPQVLTQRQVEAVIASTARLPEPPAPPATRPSAAPAAGKTAAGTLGGGARRPATWFAWGGGFAAVALVAYLVLRPARL